MVKVSVIVPVYNVEEYIKKCLDSLVNQTLNDIEIIVVNDGSPDNSQKIIDKYVSKYSFVKSYIKKNGGQASARNYGLKKATGEYITYVDSDDYIDKNMLEDLYNEAFKNNYDIMICDIYKVVNNNNFVFNNYWNVSKDANRNYMTSHTGPVARLYKRELLLNNKFKFLENVIYEDLASIPLLGMYTKNIGYINKYYYYYVIRDGSSMKQVEYNSKLEDIFKVMDYLSSNITDNNYSEELEYLYIEHLLYSASLRFIKFNKKDMLLRINRIIKDSYPSYSKNYYYKNKSIKFKIVCFLAYHKLYFLLSLLVKGR